MDHRDVLARQRERSGLFCLMAKGHSRSCFPEGKILAMVPVSFNLLDGMPVGFVGPSFGSQRLEYTE